MLTRKSASWILLLLEPAIVLYILFMTYGVYTWSDKYNSTDKGLMIAASAIILFSCIPSIIKSYRIVRQ